jgi:hypothetical protein
MTKNMDGIQETPSLFNLHQGFLKIFDKTKLNKRKWQDWIKHLCDHYNEPNYKLRKIKIKLSSTLKIGWKKSKTFKWNMAFRNIEFEIPKHNKDDTKKKHTHLDIETWYPRKAYTCKTWNIGDHYFQTLCMKPFEITFHSTINEQ